jgi:CheY-like chemotaxis protein
MRVLVAEQDLITLTRLKRMLQSFGHEVEGVRDGVAAWKFLRKSPGADVAIVNGILPGKTGLEIATDLRAQGLPHYTYVVLLAPNSEKCEVVEAMDAGADGHIVLPVSAAELAAQLKAAERILKREAGFRKQISGLQEQLRTHNIQPNAIDAATVTEPAEVPEKPEPAEPKVVEEPNPANTVQPPETPPIQLPEVGNRPPIAKMQACFDGILKRIRYVAPPDAGNDSEEPSDFTVYSAVVLEDEHLWLDMTMEMPRRAAVALYRALMSEAPHSDAELRDALEEVCNMCQGAWKTDLENAGLQPVTPGWPTARRTHEIPQCSTSKRLGASGFTLPGPIRITLLEHVAMVVEKSIADITPGEVLMDSLSVPGQKLPLMKRGTALNPRYISRILDRLKPAPEQVVTLRVVEPSPLALFMRRRGPRMTVDALLTVTVKSEGKIKQLFGRLHDLSEHGLGASIPDPLNAGQTVTLDFGLGGGDEDFRLEAILRHRQGFRCGFEFVNVPAQSAERLRQTVKELTA